MISIPYYYEEDKTRSNRSTEGIDIIFENVDQKIEIIQTKRSRLLKPEIFSFIEQTLP